MAAAAPGSVICLRGGTYQVNAEISINKSLTLQSYPGEWAILTADNSPSSPVGAVLFVGANDVTIQDMEIIGGNNYGVHVNSFLYGFPPANAKIQRVKIHHNGYIGVKVYQGDNVQILNSEIYSTGNVLGGLGIDIIAAIPSASDPGGYGAVVSGNYLHDLPADAITIKGGSVRGLIEKNRVERIAAGGISAGGDTGPQFFRNGAASECIDCVVRNNLVHTTDAYGISCSAAQGAKIANNTVIEPARAIQAAFFAHADSLGYTCNNLLLTNNVFVTSGGGRMIHVVNPGAGNVIDYNSYYNASGYYAMWQESSWVVGYWGSFNEWQSGTGQDAHSLAYTDPALDSSNLWKPFSGSPVVDRGTSLSFVPTDYLGTLRPQGGAYDMGAIELPSTSRTPARLLGVSGGGQSTNTDSSFSAPLLARVTDASGTGVAGVSVTFSIYSNGAGATFAGSASVTVTTDSSGLATSPAITANSIAGSYSATASSGSLSAVSYSLTNNAPAQPAATLTEFTSITGSSANGTVTITGTVTSPGGVVNNGSVQFFVNGVTANPVAVTNGQYSYTLTIPGGWQRGTGFFIWGYYSGSSAYTASYGPFRFVELQ